MLVPEIIDGFGLILDSQPQFFNVSLEIIFGEFCKCRALLDIVPKQLEIPKNRHCYGQIRYEILNQ